MWLELSQGRKSIERQTYSLLEWLGDIGGLYDAVHIVGGTLVGGLATLAMRTRLLVLGFRRLARSPSSSTTSGQ